MKRFEEVIGGRNAGGALRATSLHITNPQPASVRVACVVERTGVILDVGIDGLNQNQCSVELDRYAARDVALALLEAGDFAWARDFAGRL